MKSSQILNLEALTLAVLFSHLRWIFLIPVYEIVVQQNDDMALPVSSASAGHHQWQHQLFEEFLHLGPCTFIAQLVQ